MVVSEILETEPWETNEDDGCTGGVKASKDGVVSLLVRELRSGNHHDDDDEEDIHREREHSLSERSRGTR